MFQEFKKRNKKGQKETSEDMMAKNACCCSLTNSCPPFCNPMGCSRPHFPVLHHLPELAQIHVHWISDAIQPSHPVTPFSSCPQSFLASGSFAMNWLFTSGAQSIGTSASASVLQMNIQGWFPLVLTGLISLLSKESSTAPKFKSINPSAFSLLYGPTLTSVHD